MQKTKLRVLDIIRGTTVDGPGFRTSIYFAGCRHACPGCHNPQSWDFNGGRDWSVEELMEVIKEEDFDVTLSGGDPLYQAEALIPLLMEIRKTGHKVWLYTGFTFEEICSDEELAAVLPYLDGIVDGPFIEALKDPDLQFRGSSNQRILRAPFS